MSALTAWLRRATAWWPGSPVQAAQPVRGGAAREAAAVREMAFQAIESDPRFAAELFAAADRHELEQRAARPGPEARVRAIRPAVSTLMRPAS